MLRKYRFWTAVCLRLSATFFLPTVSLVSAATSVTDLGIRGDDETRDTESLQKALNDGKRELFFPPGTYRLGTIELPADTVLDFSTRARIEVEVEKIAEPRPGLRPLFLLKGDRIRFEGLDTQGIFEAQGKDAKKRTRAAVTNLIYGDGFAELKFRRLRATRLEKLGKGAPTPILLEHCRHIDVADSYFENILHGVEATECEDLRVHGNRAFECNTITTFARSEYLRHHDNWSRCVTYQCVFRGGSPDPSRKAPRVPLGSSHQAIRGLDPKSEGYNNHLAGTYDIQISNNYAEYGRTLAWGNKGRQVIFSGNDSRYMNDYSYGIEGCENVVFANNISINARSTGIMSMYWGEKLVLTGNCVIVRNEPYLQQYSDFPEQKAYWGGLLRFHHGPRSKEDTAAGSKYGAGKVIVSGNLLINELHDQVRSVRIEGGCDVMISGNKIVNGWINKGGDERNGCEGGAVTITGNEFLSDMPSPHGVVGFGAGTKQAIVKDNVMRYRGKPATAEANTPLAARTDVATKKDEAENARPDELPQTIRPAIFNGSGAKSMSLLVIEGNIIQGWTADAIGLEAVERPDAPIRFLVRNNTVEGTIRLTGEAKHYRSLVTGNTHLETLQPVEATIVTPSVGK